MTGVQTCALPIYEQQSSNQVSTDHEHQSVDSHERKDRIISLIRPWAFIKTYGKGLTQEEQPGELVNPYGEPLTVIRKDQEALNREIPLDDTSPVTFDGLLSDYVKELPAFNINFNLKMLLLVFGVFPFFVYLKLTLIMSLRMESYREFNRRFTNCSKQAIQETIFCSAIVGSNWQETIMTVPNIYQILGCALLFITLLYVRPKHLFHSYDSRGCLVPNCPSVSLGHEIIIHLNVLQHLVYDLTFFTLWKYMDRLRRCVMRCVLSKTTLNRKNRVLGSLCSFFLFFIVLLLGTTLGAICIVTFIVALVLLIFLLSPSVTLFGFVLVKTPPLVEPIFVSVNRAFYIPLMLVIWLFFTATHFFISATINASLGYIVKTFLFTVMGLVLNAELITPYVAYILVVTRNLHLCYSNLQTRYKEVKGMIAEHWKENIRELPWLDKGHDQTIPKELFWFVCGKGTSDAQKNILPLRAEICFMLRDMALTLTFLSVSLFAILAFKSMNDVSALVSTTFVFVSGVIPTLIFQGFTKKEKFSGWNKIKIEKKIKEAVKEYITKQKDDSLGRDRSFHWFFRYDSDY